MKKLNQMKAVALFFILIIAVFGCQNAPKNTEQNTTTSVAQKEYVSIAVDGMTCGGCEMTVQNALLELNGVDSAFASHVEKQVTVLVDVSKVSIQDMQKAINDKGYTAGEQLK